MMLKKEINLLILVNALMGFFLFSLIKAQADPSQKVDEALWLMENNQYELAYNIWTELLSSYDSNNANWNYNAGFCLLHSRYSKKEAIKYLKKAVTSISNKYDPTIAIQNSAPQEAIYYLGRAYHIIMEWDSAIYYFEKFREIAGMNHALIPELNRYYQYCLNGKELSKAQPQIVKITNLGEAINSEYDEYTPVLSLDENILFFTSRRPRNDPVNENPVDPSTGKYLEDIYFSYRNRDGSWTKAQLFKYAFNSNDAVVSINPTGTVINIYVDDAGDGNLYYSYITDTGFTAPERYPFPINTKYYEGHITFSPDESEAVFTSDRPGGYGGKDLWYIKKLPTGEFGSVKNPGPVINTPYDEDAPFWFVDGKTLYFSSQGHKSIGGFDIFYSERNDTGGWSKPVNAGIPINTPEDDIFAYFSPDGKRLYFTTERDDSYGGKDIYMAELAIEEEKEVALLSGEIAFEGDTLPKGIKILAYDANTYALVAESRPNPFTKTFFLPLTPGKTYAIVYVFASDTIGREEIYVPYGTSFSQIKKILSLKGVALKGISELSPEEKPLDLRLVTTQFPHLFPKGIVVKIINESGEIIAQKILTSNGTTKFPPIKTIKERKLKYIDIEAPIEGLIDCSKAEIEIKDEKGRVIAKAYSKEGCRFEIKYIENEFSSNTTTDTSKGEEEIVLAKKEITPAENVKIPETVQELKAASSFKRFSFTKYFKYNEFNIDVEDESWKKFVEMAYSIFKEKGKIYVTIEGSASKVPTKTFVSNEKLAFIRAQSSTDLLKSEMTKAGIPQDKIIIRLIRGYVQGPEYNPSLDPGVYEDFQYVKITIE